MVDFMEDEFIYRQMQTTDSFAFGNLVQSSPDTGRIGAKAIYQLDPYQVALLRHSDTVGIVVESCETHELVGAGLISFKRHLFDGGMCNYALLHSLVVHPNYRRQGIAAELNQRRLTRISQRLGDDPLVVASIQQGNEGSSLVARKWCNQLVGSVHATLSKMRTSPPDPIHNITVRKANSSDLEETVLRQN